MDHPTAGSRRREPLVAPGTPSRQAKQVDTQALLTEAGHISATDVEAEIRARAQAFQAQWGESEPKAVAVLMHGFAQTFQYVSIDFPQDHVSLSRTTNLLERFQKEIRRKQRDIGLFQSFTGCDVLWYMSAMRETVKQRVACRRQG